MFLRKNTLRSKVSLRVNALNWTHSLLDLLNCLKNQCLHGRVVKAFD